MRSSLFDYEWQFLTQMITRIHYTASYEELCRLLLEDQLPTLIPFDRAVVFQTGRQNGQGTVAAPYTVGMPNDPKKNPFLDRAVIPRWSQFIMAPHSTVFLQSDLIAAEDWIHSDIYRNIWEPCRLYWALGATIQYRDRPLALVALFRERDKADFNPKEFHILHTLKDALEPYVEGNKNIFYMIKATGVFKTMHVRSCFPSEKPYPTLSEVAKNQREFHFANTRGSVIAVYCPAYVNGINLPGWHFHYLSGDKTQGGHILGLSADSLRLKINKIERFDLTLPQNPEFAHRDLCEDLTAKTAAVEGVKK